MKATCERCQAELGFADHAYICSYECTYCTQCCEELHAICPQCGGELVRRPTREIH